MGTARCNLNYTNDAIRSRLLRTHWPKVWELNPQGFRSAVFKTAAVTSRLALPEMAERAGIEPARLIARLVSNEVPSPTVGLPLQVNVVWKAGFEPALTSISVSCLCRLGYSHV
jgi:hypothetical protein